MNLKESIENLISDVRAYQQQHGTSRFEWKLRHLQKVIDAEPGLVQTSTDQTPMAKILAFPSSRAKPQTVNGGANSGQRVAR